MKKENKGFSLVELIIVIAIMAVLIGLLAPQYLRFVNRSRVVADIQNADALAKAIDATIAEKAGNSVHVNINNTPGGTTISGVNGVTEVPVCKVDSSLTWTVVYTDSSGVTSIKLGGDDIYPLSDAYYAAHYY